MDKKLKQLKETWSLYERTIPLFDSGAWITPKGNILPVPYFKHSQILNSSKEGSEVWKKMEMNKLDMYDAARELGWIRVDTYLDGKLSFDGRPEVLKSRYDLIRSIVSDYENRTGRNMEINIGRTNSYER